MFKSLILHIILDRKFSPEELIACGAWADEKEHLVTFPLYNVSGQMTGFQEYRPKAGKQKNNVRGESRYWTYMTKGNLAYWGQHSFNGAPVLFLTEGFMDAARLTSLGCQAVATLSNNPKHMKRLIDIWKSKYVVIALLDNDPSGKQLAKFGHYSYVMESDVNDASDQEIEKLFEDVAGLFNSDNINKDVR